MTALRRSGAITAGRLATAVACAGSVVVGSVAIAACGGGSTSASDSRGATPTFVDETAAAGLDHVYDGDFEFFVGGGVATFDCDEDGLPDLYFAGGTRPAALYRNDSPVGGALRFSQLASPVTDLTAVTGAYPIDVDGDGHLDLVVLRRGPNVVLRGHGDCTFEDATAAFGVDPGEDWTAAFSATWEGSNRLPTLAFGNYLVPDTYDCAESQLVRPRPAGDGYDAPHPLAPGYCTLSILFTDWSHSGRHDLRMTNDRHYYADGEDQLWRIDAGQAPTEYTRADGWQPLQLWGMGIASQDLDGDGLPEVFVTSQADNKLQTLARGAAQPMYRDIALDSGVTAQRPVVGDDVLPSTAWHAQFDDVNNDSYFDLFISKGNVEAEPDYAKRDPSNLFLGSAEGTFTERSDAAGIVDYDRARGAALADLNMDGLLDLVVVYRRTEAQVWRNVGSGDASSPAPMGHWLGVAVHQPAPNVDAIGGWLQVQIGDRIVSRELTIGGGHASGQLGWVHLGLGSSAAAKLRVQWPDGTAGPWIDVAADQYVTIDRGATAARPWSAG